MKKRHHLYAGLILFCAGQTIAGNRPGATTLTLAGAYYHFASSRHLDNTSLPNVALAYDFTDRWAIEGNVGAVNTNQKPVLGGADVHGFLYTVDGIYRLMPHQSFEPYVIAGVGVLAMKPNGLNSQHQGNLNAGIGTQVFFGDMIALRGEIRDLYTTTGPGKNDYMINFGVSFLMGSQS
jgi:outer membrane protein W